MRNADSTIQTAEEAMRQQSRGTTLPELCFKHRPPMKEGAGNAGCWPQPMARQQTKKLAAVTTGSAESSGIPCAMVLTLIARSPWEPGFLTPIARELIISRA
jgi:hypothetical protein